jgi:hypothetical protein
MRLLVTLSIISAVALFSCKNSSKAMEADKITTTKPNSSNGNITEVIKNEEGIYDIIISFASRGAGINRDARKSLDEALEKFTTENKVELNLEKYGWGREGEVDYLILTKNLSTKQKKALIAQIKATVGTADQVLISYDQKSVHKR